MDFSSINTIKNLTLLELDCDKEISVEQIRSQYRKLCRIYHPDVSNERYNDGQKFIQLTAAEEYLIENIDNVNVQIRNKFCDNTTNSTENTINNEEPSAPKAQYSTNAEKQAGIKHLNIWQIISILFVLFMIYTAYLSVVEDSEKSYSSSAKKQDTTVESHIATTAPTIDTSLPLPSNGKVFYCERSDLYSTLYIDNKSDMNIYIKLVDTNEYKALTGFIRAHSEVTFDVPAKELFLKLTCGDKWYGEAAYFKNNYRAMDPNPYDFYNQSFKLAFAENSNLGENIDLIMIDPEDF